MDPATIAAIATSIGSALLNTIKPPQTPQMLQPVGGGQNMQGPGPFAQFGQGISPMGSALMGQQNPMMGGR